MTCKKPLWRMIIIFWRLIHNLLCQVPPDLLPNDSVGRISRELWWTNQEISPVSIIPLCSHITWGINNRPIRGHSSDTWSHHINMIIIKYWKNFYEFRILCYVIIYLYWWRSLLYKHLLFHNFLDCFKLYCLTLVSV
jgi:hypothetical protein